MATLLIIGGTGFFGKSILDCYNRGFLAEWGISKVTVMSRHIEDFKVRHPELLLSNVDFFQGDIKTTNFLPYADYVIYAATSTNASLYSDHKGEAKKNIDGVLNYCKLAEKFHSRSKIVYCSSGAVYGRQPEGVRRLSEFEDLGDIRNLEAGKMRYAYAKIHSEYAIQNLGKKGMNVSIARCFSFVGKYLPLSQHFAIGNFISDGLSNRDINVRADRMVYRSYMYADDLVEWLMSIAQKSSPTCSIYNVASDEEIEIGELANIVANIFRVSVRYEKSRTESIDRYIPSISKALNELGLRNKYTLEKAILASI